MEMDRDRWKEAMKNDDIIIKSNMKITSMKKTSRTVIIIIIIMKTTEDSSKEDNA